MSDVLQGDDLRCVELFTDLVHRAASSNPYVGDGLYAYRNIRLGQWQPPNGDRLPGQLILNLSQEDRDLLSRLDKRLASQYQYAAILGCDISQRMRHVKGFRSVRFGYY